MSSDTFAKWLGIGVTIGTPLIALLIHVGALEDAKNGHADVLAEQRVELRRLADRVADLERERWAATQEMGERIHAIDMRLARMEEMMRNDRRGRR